MDCLVKLYQLPPVASLLESLTAREIHIRRPLAYEKHQVLDWIEMNFSPSWRSEADCAFHSPVTCFIALRHRQIIGFVCYEVTAKNFFGPLGIAESYRKQQVGSALALKALWSMWELGYGYAIIGSVAPEALPFYQKLVSAFAIPDSSPGIYAERLNQ